MKILPAPLEVVDALALAAEAAEVVEEDRVEDDVVDVIWLVVAEGDKVVEAIEAKPEASESVERTEAVTLEEV